MRLLQLSSVCALFLMSAAFAADKKPDFSGTWLLNNDKSVLGDGGRRWNAGKLIVAQAPNKLSIKRVVTRDDGQENITTDTFTLDGKECNNSTENRTKKSTVTWSKDSTSLNFSTKSSFERNGETMESTGTEIWKLAEKGAVLSIDFASTSSRGERKGAYIYDKEKPPAK
jgi:hypothetical protein